MIAGVIGAGWCSSTHFAYVARLCLCDAASAVFVVVWNIILRFAGAWTLLCDILPHAVTFSAALWIDRFVTIMLLQMTRPPTPFATSTTPFLSFFGYAAFFGPCELQNGNHAAEATSTIAWKSICHQSLMPQTRLAHRFLRVTRYTNDPERLKADPLWHIWVAAAVLAVPTMFMNAISPRVSKVSHRSEYDQCG